MEQWRISAASYYADWFTIPLLILCAFITDYSYHGGLSWVATIAFVLGVITMSFIEYAMHRWAFHNPKLYRKDHWLHHIRPADYVGVPSYRTTFYFLIALGLLWATLGIDFGGGMFNGIAAYYLAYIFVHDRFHHGDLGLLSNGYWNRRRLAHLRHHRHGEEVNFGVATHWWDVLFGTFRRHF